MQLSLYSGNFWVLKTKWLRTPGDTCTFVFQVINCICFYIQNLLYVLEIKAEPFYLNFSMTFEKHTYGFFNLYTEGFIETLTEQCALLRSHLKYIYIKR